MNPFLIAIVAVALAATIDATVTKYGKRIGHHLFHRQPSADRTAPRDQMIPPDAGPAQAAPPQATQDEEIPEVIREYMRRMGCDHPVLVGDHRVRCAEPGEIPPPAEVEPEPQRWPDGPPDPLPGSSEV